VQGILTLFSVIAVGESRGGSLDEILPNREQILEIHVATE